MNKTRPFDLEDFLPYRLNRLAEAVSREFASVYGARYGLTRPQWRVLANLGQHGELTARAICNLSNQHKTKVSRAVAALEQRRWLKRHPSPHDRREEFLSLTAAGVKIFDDLAREADAYAAGLEARIGAKAMRGMEAGLSAFETRMDRPAK